MRKQSKRAVGAGATAYMGPERFESDPTPVKASEIWSLVASIYELATGELTFSGLGGGMQRNGAEMPVLDNTWSKDMTMVMQSCLAKDTWDRPTAQQLEEYSDAIIKGQPAKASWTIPTSVAEVSVTEPTESNTSSIHENSEEESHSNRKRIWIAVGGIIAAIILLILIWPSSNTDEPIVIPEDTVEEVDSVVDETTKEQAIDIPEVESKKAAQEQTATPAPQKTKKEEPKVEVEESKKDNNATLLKKALSNGDYQQVQKLANQGYAAAYGPLAKYYLNNHDYKTAELYAKKAKSAGFSEGANILKTLENLGYYD